MCHICEVPTCLGHAILGQTSGCILIYKPGRTPNLCARSVVGRWCLCRTMQATWLSRRSLRAVSTESVSRLGLAPQIKLMKAFSCGRMGRSRDKLFRSMITRPSGPHHGSRNPTFSIHRLQARRSNSIRMVCGKVWKHRSETVPLCFLMVLGQPNHASRPCVSLVQPLQTRVGLHSLPAWALRRLARTCGICC